MQRQTTRTNTRTRSSKKITMWKRFYLDDKTNRWSDTTIRTWLLFALLFLYSIFLAVSIVIDLFTTNSKNFANAFSFYELLALVTAGGGTLYLGKRMTQKKETEGKEFEDL